MGNVISLELSARDFDVDVGFVEYNCKNKDGKSRRFQLEVDY
jgi:hypothetical protein